MTDLKALNEQERHLKEVVSRADQAKRLLEDPLLVDAFQAIDDFIMERWRKCVSGEEREELHRELVALGRVKRAMETHIRDGQVAEADLIHVQERKKSLMNRFVRTG